MPRVALSAGSLPEIRAAELELKMNICGATTIEALDLNRGIFVLKDEQGQPIGTGTREAMQVLSFVAKQNQSPRSPAEISGSTRYHSDIRSALVF